MASTNFYFGRLEFFQAGLDDFSDNTPRNPIERRYEKLLEYVRKSDVVFTEPMADGEEALWRFGKCETQEGNVILGKFGKIFTEEQTQWDDRREDYVKEREEVEVADVSHFVIFPEIPGIAFNRKHRIGPNQFRDAFVQGYNGSELSGKLDMTILRAGGDKEFTEVVSMARDVKKVDFELEPTNPYPEDEMEILDDHIRAMNADEFQMVASVDEDDDGDNESLNPREDFIRSGAALSEGGYGEYLINLITEDGEEVVYNSRGERATEELPEPETPGGLRPYLRQIHDRLEGLSQRFDSSEVDDNSDSGE